MDRLRILRNAQESETMAKSLIYNYGFYLVPAFLGFFVPRWLSSERGFIVGMTTTHDRRHFDRAALESFSYQASELFDVVQKNSGIYPTKLRVNRGGNVNALLMQFQCNILRRGVVVPKVK